MITKAQVKHIRSLEDKKNRRATGQFVVEGDKMVRELLSSSLRTLEIFATSDWLEVHANNIPSNTLIHEVSESMLSSLSFLTTPNKVLALAALPAGLESEVRGVSLVLDDIQDPGNMGTLIRTADWFGVKQIYASPATADAFNPKVVQASMGSVFRVNISVTDITQLLKENHKLPAYAAVLGGEDIGKVGKIKEGFIVLGNESKGIHPEILARCKHKLTIPKHGQAESLNVAVAAGIICQALL
ncbi:MAG: RNA methyltransferase [Chitinophagaceae bacterium]|nr:RNA methyltransferase [Chitinophagaceae bacterium]